MNKNIFTILIVFITISCKTQSQKLDCLNSIIEKNRKDKNYYIIENTLKDSIANWNNNNNNGLIQGYNEDEWKIDAIIFNKQKNRCLIIILEIDTRSNASLDYVDYALGEKKQELNWDFFITGIAGLAIPKGESFENLSIIAREKIIEGGILSKHGCVINNDYINGWFNEELYIENKKNKFKN